MENLQEKNILNCTNMYQKNFKVVYLKFLNEISVSETTPAEWNCATVISLYTKGDRKDQNN